MGRNPFRLLLVSLSSTKWHMSDSKWRVTLGDLPSLVLRSSNKLTTVKFLFFSGFEPVRISVQGEVIRDLDTNNHQQNRRANHGDSDDEDQQSHSTMNGRGTMNIYQERQQKRAKLTD
jgi:hypothetical protein